MDKEKPTHELDLQLVEDLKYCYRDLSLDELKDFMLFKSVDSNYPEAIEALKSLGCPMPSSEEVQKYLSFGTTPEERSKRRREEERRLNTEKYWILRKNSPKLDAELREAHERREGASKRYGRIRDGLWERHKEYKRATDPYWCSGAMDYQFEELLDRNPDTRDVNRTHHVWWQKSQDLEDLFSNQARKLSLEEAKATNLDDRFQTEEK